MELEKNKPITEMEGGDYTPFFSDEKAKEAMQSLEKELAGIKAMKERMAGGSSDGK